MAHVLGKIICLFLSLFIVTSSMNVGQEFFGPNLSELGDISMNSSPISTITAVDIKRQDVSEISPERATKDKLSSLSYEQSMKKEILEDVENMNMYMKMIAEELANDGIIIVRAVKTNNIMDSQNDEVIDNDKEKSSTSLGVYSAGTKSSPNVNYLAGMKVAKPAMCKKPETKLSSSRIATTASKKVM